MAKLTNNIGGSNENQTPESGVDLYLTFYKQKTGGNYFDKASRETHELESINGAFLWLGHFIRYQGQSKKHNVNLYSTAFENSTDSIEVRVKSLEGDNQKPVLVYTGKANDQACKEKVNYYESRYTLYLILINEKGRLVFAKLDGVNIGPYFDYIRANGESEFIGISGQVEQQNPAKPKESVYVVDFYNPKGINYVNIDAEKMAKARIDQVSEYLAHILYFARTGKHVSESTDYKPADPRPEPEPQTQAEPQHEKPLPAGAATDDDDLPF